MKKFLLFVSVAAMSLSAAAQDLPTGEVYLRNVKTGMYLNGGFTWGTKAILKEQARAFEVVSQPDDYFALKNSCGFVKSGGTEYFVDGTEEEAASLYAEKLANGCYIIDFGGTVYLCPEKNGETGEVNAMMSYKEEGPWGWWQPYDCLNAYDFYPVSHSSTYDAADESIQWEFLTREQMIANLADASDANPIDASFLIKAYNLDIKDADNTTAWVKTSETGNVYFAGGSPDGAPDSSSDWGHHLNSWQNAAIYALFTNDNPAADCTDVISQEIADAPAGTYQVEYRVVNQTTSPFTLSFNDTKGEVTAWEGNDLWGNDASCNVLCDKNNIKTAYFEVKADGKLAIKMTKESKTGVQNRFAFKYFYLTYLGKNSEHSGVEGIVADDADAPVEYYNMQGMRIAEPTTGLYIVKQGSKVSKQLIRK